MDDLVFSSSFAVGANSLWEGRAPFCQCYPVLLDELWSGSQAGVYFMEAGRQRHDGLVHGGYELAASQERFGEWADSNCKTCRCGAPGTRRVIVGQAIPGTVAPLKMKMVHSGDPIVRQQWSTQTTQRVLWQFSAVGRLEPGRRRTPILWHESRPRKRHKEIWLCSLRAVTWHPPGSKEKQETRNDGGEPTEVTHKSNWCKNTIEDQDAIPGTL